jgi:hypothetical protein
VDKDMHYYGTYALARAAGVRADTARTIATAAQYVDDSNGADEAVVHPDGARFRLEATAHHPFSIKGLVRNNDLDDQQLVWVPFHFLPGGEGDTQSRRLICRKDSKFARAMVQHHLALAEDHFFGIELMGITAHVYADTFAHYGFSGVSSRVNRVVASSIRAENATDIPSRLDRFFAKFGMPNGLANFRTRVESFIGQQGTELDPAATGALGHGAVATFPDQPYMRWSYTYEMPEHSGITEMKRNNAQDYEEAAAALHAMCRKVAALKGGLHADGPGLAFERDVRLVVRKIFAEEKPTQDRIGIWKAAIADGRLGAPPGDQIPDYDPEAWTRDAQELSHVTTAERATERSAYRFHRAAAIHRNYVLTELLPRMGVYII